MAKHSPKRAWLRCRDRRDKALRRSAALRGCCSLLERLGDAAQPIRELATKKRIELEAAEATIAVLPLAKYPPIELAAAVSNVTGAVINASVELYAACESAGFSADELTVLRGALCAASEGDT